MRLSKNIEVRFEMVARHLDLGEVEMRPRFENLEKIMRAEPSTLTDYLAVKDWLEQEMEGPIRDVEFDEYCLDRGWLDLVKVRRRVENWLRKKASPESILRMARWSGVRTY
jgi:hypothetical protein